MRIWLTPASRYLVRRHLARRISDWMGMDAGVVAIIVVALAIVTVVALAVFG